MRLPALLAVFVTTLGLASAQSVASELQATYCSLPSATASNSASAASASTTSRYRAKIGFGFEILDIETNHAFPGQRSSFKFDYLYLPNLAGAGYNVNGTAVSADTYPYYQTMRNDAISFVQNYPAARSQDFYELYVNEMATMLMDKYPQLATLTVRIDVPAFSQVNIARRGVVTLTRP